MSFTKSREESWTFRQYCWNWNIFKAVNSIPAVVWAAALQMHEFSTAESSIFSLVERLLEVAHSGAHGIAALRTHHYRLTQCIDEGNKDYDIIILCVCRILSWHDCSCNGVERARFLCRNILRIALPKREWRRRRLRLGGNWVPPPLSYPPMRLSFFVHGRSLASFPYHSALEQAILGSHSLTPTKYHHHVIPIRWWWD